MVLLVYKMYHTMTESDGVIHPGLDFRQGTKMWQSQTDLQAIKQPVVC